MFADDTVKFAVKQLHVDNNEGADIADVNNDGKPDLIAGRFWYEGPDFTKHPLRQIDDWNGYVASNGDFAVDVDGDGNVDIIAGAFVDPIVKWYRNPGKDGLASETLWQGTEFIRTENKTNELSFMHDIDGDGIPDWITNSWNVKSPVVVYQLARNSKGELNAIKHVIGEGPHGHGMGFGDLNGNGREDILVGEGWYERPEGDPFKQTWTYHADWHLHASCPMLVMDVNGDGRNDIIYGLGHDYGLFWREQIAPTADGKLQWQEHLIDKEYSQPHSLALADLDGDGQPELITGKRKFAHNGKDPGGMDAPCLYYYTIDRKSGTFTRHTIDVGQVGTGLQIRTADLNGDGRTDIFVAGKSGTYVLINQGK
ncbi:MAG: VCBS repeat-containing protein [Planctomycetes bacterium]|nr:VCBS repeat-containing protein [Planctomycetota bacterium]